MNIFRILRLSILITLLPFVTAFAGAYNSAPDATASGPHETQSGEYRFPATDDTEVMSDRMTEIWGKMFYPKDIANAKEKAPLVIMLHGNHGTCGKGTNPRRDYSCTYTNSGKCPNGYVVTPNHEGYDYLAKNLASWGFIVVSINANRGITCGSGTIDDSGLNLARGRLVLKHLSLLKQWTTTGDAPAALGLGADGLMNKIDFAAVGLFGHSRGGEGVRAAYNLYRDSDSIWPSKIPDLEIKAIFEVGAVDGQTSRVLDANGIAWNQLLPMCDGDVSDLQGRFPFERMLLNKAEPAHAQKSLYEVWGANHNYFNTEWQTSDSNGCSTGTPIFANDRAGSPEQQTVALASVPAFFRSHLGKHADASLNQNFNPLHSLPAVVTTITQVDRDFTASPGATEQNVVEDFDKATGINSSGFRNHVINIDIHHEKIERYSKQRVANIVWKAAGTATIFEAVWAPVMRGRDIHAAATLDFRISRQKHELNSEPSTDFGVALEEPTGHLSHVVHISDYVLLNGPGTDNHVLQTVRIPLSAFSGVNLKQIHGVRFVFDKTATGAIYLANIRVHKQMGLGTVVQPNIALRQLERAVAMQGKSPRIEYVSENQNTIRRIQSVQKSQFMGGKPAVEIVVASKVPFPVMNRLPVLRIGTHEFTVSRYSDADTLQEMTFTLPADEYLRLDKSSEVTVVNGKVWKFGVMARVQW